MAKVLIIDDDPSVSKILAELLFQSGHEVVLSHCLTDGLSEAQTHPYDIIVLDINLPDGNGLQIIPELHQAQASPEVIVLTGHGDMDSAEMAIKKGAWDFVQKEDSPRKFLLRLERAVQYRNTHVKKTKRPAALDLEGIVGSSSQMKRCYGLLEQAALSGLHVHITGETGTGKEVFARAIHKNSVRRKKSFVVVDCASLPETLVESMLFGHIKGAFTGADIHRKGLIAQAHGGTLFLDEIGELPLAVQRIFLRVLEDSGFRHVGSDSEIKSDFRLITATNRDLEKNAIEGAFRKDLLFRLRGIVIDLPPLRERPGDIEELAQYYNDVLCERYRLKSKTFSPEFVEAMTAYSWPGNVRELIKALENAISGAQDEDLFPVHLPTQIRAQLVRDSIASGILKDENFTEIRSRISAPLPKMRELLDNVERQYLEYLMSQFKGNKKEISAITGISISRLYDRLKKYQIRFP